MVAQREPKPLLRAVALSGGPDSLCAAALMPPGRALIVDHGLRAGSRDEAQWAAQRAEELGHRAQILTWKHDQVPRTQAAYRAGRYALLAKACQDQGIGELWTGHQADDQGETVVLRLSKGSGLLGLSGMAYKSWIGNTRLVRPLLTTSKSQILTWLKDRDLDFVQDPSNQDMAYLRVQWRHFLDDQPRLNLKAQTLSKQVGGLRNANLRVLSEIQLEVEESGVVRLPLDLDHLCLAAKHELLTACARWVGGVAIPRVSSLIQFMAQNPSVGQQAAAARTLLWRRKDGFLMVPENRSWQGPQQADPYERAQPLLARRQKQRQNGLWFPGDQARQGGIIVGQGPRLDHVFATKSTLSPLGN